MTLRHKFGLLAAIYITTLVGSFALCARCIVDFYSLLLQEFGTPPTQSLAASDPDSGIERVADTSDEAGEQLERRAVVLLTADAVIGALLGLVGVYLVSRWIARPIEDLRGATARIGQGDWSTRIPPRSGDELGLLAADVNRMAAAIMALQQEVSQRERRITGAEALRCITHNIRSPLTGIRWLAEVMGERLKSDPQAVFAEERIMLVVDRVLSSLAESRAAYARAAAMPRPRRAEVTGRSTPRLPEDATGVTDG